MKSSLALFLFFYSATAVAQFTPPKLTGFIVDNAKIIKGRTSTINSLLGRLKNETQTHIIVLTVPSLGGESIESASIKVTDQWKLGDEKTDKGLLLIIAPKERKVRIEVGQGLEGDITDAFSKRVIDQVLLPSFKQGQYDRGVLIALTHLIQKAEPAFYGTLGLKERKASDTNSRAKKKAGPLQTIIYIVFVFLFLIFGRRGGRGGVYYGGGFGGRGGGGFGGGGFGGGGGGFSGGGASGGW